MTAAAGILHEEFHSEAFAGKGGDFEMVQLWVNLPAAHKMATPGYQAIANGDIPVVSLADDAGTVRVIRSEEHTSELQSLMRISYAVFCLKKKKQKTETH